MQVTHRWSPRPHLRPFGFHQLWKAWTYEAARENWEKSEIPRKLKKECKRENARKSNPSSRAPAMKRCATGPSPRTSQFPVFPDRSSPRLLSATAKCHCSWLLLAGLLQLRHVVAEVAVHSNILKPVRRLSLPAQDPSTLSGSHPERKVHTCPPSG